MEDCIRDIRSWMLNTDLKFNDKTDLKKGSSQQLKKLDNISIRVGDSDIRDLKIEVFRHFLRTANVKKSRDQSLAVRFALLSGLRFEVHVCMSRPRSRGK